MTGQLESIHFFRPGDLVRSTDGRYGKVIESWTLYALIEWDGGVREEFDQFDPGLIVVERAESG